MAVNTVQFEKGRKRGRESKQTKRSLLVLAHQGGKVDTVRGGINSPRASSTPKGSRRGGTSGQLRNNAIYCTQEHILPSVLKCIPPRQS